MKALKISFEAHKDQVDKCGIPYVFHPFHVAEQMTDEITTCTALLHDVAEDTDITIEDLREYGFPEKVLDALELLTHQKDESYLEYINRIKDNPVAKAVKLADLEHNMDMSRIEHPSAIDFERLKKYRWAVVLLNDWSTIQSFKEIDAQVTPCCGTSVPKDYHYCSYCGKELPDTESTKTIWDTDFTCRYCPVCQKIIPIEDIYCGYCGTKIR